MAAAQLNFPSTDQLQKRPLQRSLNTKWVADFTLARPDAPSTGVKLFGDGMHVFWNQLPWLNEMNEEIRRLLHEHL